MVSLGKNPFGFTIIEVMIVLASTGALLLIAFSIINGEVKSTAKINSIKSFQIGLQNFANSVTSGRYTFADDTMCTDNGNGSGPSIQISHTPSTQGASDNCQFLGKLMALPSNTSNDQSLDIFPVAGTQCTNSAQPCVYPTDLASSNPRVVNVPSDISSLQLGTNLYIRCIYYSTGHCQGTSGTYQKRICSFGILAQNNNLASGSEYDLYPVDDCSNSLSYKLGTIGQPFDQHNPLNSTDEIHICVSDSPNPTSSTIFTDFMISSGANTSNNQAVQGSNIYVSVMNGNTQCF
jgi:hypothetical protein